MSEDENPWRRTRRELVYSNPWIEVRADEVIRPDGNPGPYTFVHFRNLAVGILPVHQDGSVELAGQWRYTLDRYSWEIPEGGCRFEEGETPEQAARRELAEETGLAAGELVELGRGHLSNSVTDEVSVMFLARHLMPSREEHPPDPTEDLARRRVPFDELLAMIHAGEVTDALTLTTVLRYRLHLERG